MRQGFDGTLARQHGCPVNIEPIYLRNLHSPYPTATAQSRMASNRAARRLALSSFESFRLGSENYAVRPRLPR